MKIRDFFVLIIKKILASKKLTIIAAVAIVVIMVALTAMLTRTIVTTETRAVEFGLKDIGEMVTQAGYYTEVHPFEKAQDLFNIQVPLTKSQYIVCYDGVIKAGIDFADIKLSIDSNNKKVKLELPEAYITSNEIDENSFECYYENESIFTPISIKDMNASLVEIKQKAQEKAIEKGILDNAIQNAKVLIKNFLSQQYPLEEYTYIFE